MDKERESENIIH